MNGFLKSGITYKVTSREALDLHDTLPTGNYILKVSREGYYLEEASKFTFTGKQYGNMEARYKRIYNTFQSRSQSTGVMLTGLKGSGKSMLAKLTCDYCAKHDVPTIIINTPLVGDDFNTFISEIEQPVVILFDEFEKVYDDGDQQKLLTLLDGVFPSKKLFLFTCNDKWRVSAHLRNRPGRIYYMLDFKGLDLDFVREYCEDNLDNKAHINRIVDVSALFSEFNFDMLKALVAEMNLYKESPEEALSMLNVKPEFEDGNQVFSIKLLIGEKQLPSTYYDHEWTGNPLTSVIGLYYKLNEEDDTDIHICFSNKHIVSIDPKSGTFVFKNGKDSLILTKKIVQAVDPLKLL